MSNYYTEYRLKITFGDQDLINIYFHYFPGKNNTLNPKVWIHEICRKEKMCVQAFNLANNVFVMC